MSNFLLPDDLRSLAKVTDALDTVADLASGLSFEVKVFDENGDVVGFLGYDPRMGSYGFVTTLED